MRKKKPKKNQPSRHWKKKKKKEEEEFHFVSTPIYGCAHACASTRDVASGVDKSNTYVVAPSPCTGPPAPMGVRRHPLSSRGAAHARRVPWQG
mmetsp:Transcript_10262/g.26030  ORF Transcript_10262/g.26030 Transcript_10262/m.26030 type:complete len:93 (-) Transcript_10262:116-394(-)